MPEFYKSSIPIIDTEGPRTNLSHPKNATYGMVERNYDEQPESMFAPPSDMVLIQQSDWDAYFDEQEERQSSLEHIYLPNGPDGAPAFVNLDQNGQGFCWSYSTGHSIMMDQLKRGGKVNRLNPHANALIIKKGQDEGGWCGLSAQWGREHGYAIEGTGPGQWPKQSMNMKYDTAALRANMALHKIEEEWTDMTRQVYDQNLTQLQVATCGFNNIPGPRDYNWWSHSVCGIRWVRIAKGDWGQLILNSWANWGRHGLAVLRGSKAVCNGGLAVRLTSG